MNCNKEGTNQLQSNQIKKVLVLIREMKPEICVSGVQPLTTGKLKLIKFIIDPGACFSKVPKLFGRISGDIILFVSSKLRRLEARNFAVFIFIPFTTYEKTSFTE